MSALVQISEGLQTPRVFRGELPDAGPLVDTFGRRHSDLRISVTDRCNIRCFYCMPETGAEFTPASNLLSFAEIMLFVNAAVALGIDKIRLTGGEPLLRPKLSALVEQIANLSKVRDLALTTNGVLLMHQARSLYDAGLRRLNVHLDTLDRERFRAITRRDDLYRVLRGLDAAVAAGFTKIKLNAVAVKNLTEPDVIPLVRFGREHGMEVRFIEFMPLDAQQLWKMDRVLTAADLISILEREFGPLEAVPDSDPRAPATEYSFSDGYRVGFIASVSRPFCMNCNRLRLTSDGKLRYCLFANEETDVRPLLNGASGGVAQLTRAIRQTVWDKWAGHEIQRSSFVAPVRPMHSIGG